MKVPCPKGLRGNRPTRGTLEV